MAFKLTTERERERLLNEYHKKVGLDVMVGKLLLGQKGEGISIFTFQLIKQNIVTMPIYM